MPLHDNRAIRKHLGLLLIVIVGWIGSGCSGTAPTVQLENAPDTLAVEERAVFEFSHNDNASTPLELQWDFGNDTVHDSLRAAHRFAEPGQYTVRFMARNDAGFDTDSVAVQVQPRPVQLAALQGMPNPTTVNEPVSFSAQLAEGTPVSYRWSFGDGTTVTGAEPTHKYDAPGTYTVSVEVENEVSTDERTIDFVVEDPLPPICMVISEFNPFFFERNSSTLADEGREGLEENVEILHECPNLRIEVQGMALLSEDDPETLTRERAQALSDFYVEEHGFNPDRISIRDGCVEDMPPTHVHTSPDGTKVVHEIDLRRWQRADSFPVRESP